MAAHSSTQLANGHTFIVVELPMGVPAGDGSTTYARVEERNELGVFIKFAYAAASVADCEAWVQRQVAREGGVVPVTREQADLVYGMLTQRIRAAREAQS